MTFLELIPQKRLAPIFKTTYGGPQYNYVKGSIQRIELHRGCPWQHEYCYEPAIHEDFPIPELTRNYVQILDMNFLCRSKVLDCIRELGEKRVNGRVVHYECVCGLDFRLLTKEIAEAMKQARFVKPRLAWDGPFSDQYKIKDAVGILEKVGYKPKEISMFVIVNWRIPRTECERKLDLLKVWNIKICDCCYDGGYRYATPMFWTMKDLKEFRAKSRKHNQLINFGVDPEP